MQLNDHVIGVGSERTARLLSHFADGIEQAIHGGWNQNLLEDPWYVHVDHYTRHANLCYPRPSIGQTAHVDMFAVLCDHWFVRAVWGEDVGSPCRTHGVVHHDLTGTPVEPAMYHLALMLVQDDPLTYLGYNLCRK